MASEMDVPQPSTRARLSTHLDRKRSTRRLLDALVRLVELLDEPALVPRLAPLIQQEITIRLLTGPHGPQLRHLVTAGSPSQQIAKAVAWLKQNFAQRAARGRSGGSRAHEPIDLSTAFPRHHGHESVAVPEAIASAGSAATDAQPRTSTRATPAGLWAMRAPRSSAASTAACSARRLSAISGACD